MHVARVTDAGNATPFALSCALADDHRRSLDDPMPILTLFVSWEPAVHPKLLVTVDLPQPGTNVAPRGPLRPSSGPFPRSVQVRVPTRPATVLPPTRTQRELLPPLTGIPG